MRLWTTYHPNGEFYCFSVENGKGTTHHDWHEFKSEYDCFRAGAQWILDNL